MRLIRGIQTAAVTGAVVGTAALASACSATGAPAHAATTAQTTSLAQRASSAQQASSAHTTSSAGRTQPVSASWLSAERGIVLAYPTQHAGAKPELLMTQTGGRTWQQLSPPPVPWPATDDIPRVTWTGAAILVDNGASLFVSHDLGQHWTAVTGLPATFQGGAVTDTQPEVAGGRVYLIVVKATPSVSTATVYSGPVGADAVRTVPGMSVRGRITDADISAVGGLQISLGTVAAGERYWAAAPGGQLKAAPSPCSSAASALLGGVQDGKPVALCSTETSSGGGSTEKQIYIASRLGGVFLPSGRTESSPEEDTFAAASDTHMTVATDSNLEVTANAGQTWTAQAPQRAGVIWTSLQFPDATTGYAVANTSDSADNGVGILYRTTNAGQSWQPVPVPVPVP